MLGQIIFAVLVAQAFADNDNSTVNGRSQKALSVFQIVRFPNSICSGTGSYNGTCFTATECTAKGGTASGTCASSFGVCCVFVLGCGGTTTQNCTYFQSSANTLQAGQCTLKICKCSPDICQIRLDFQSFVIAGPSTLTASSAYEVGGSAATAAGKKVSLATTCLTDTFSLTGPAGSVPPVICGTNTGEHMYVDASDTCNNANFQLGQTAVGTALPTRSWNIKITQLSCFDRNLAPSGCTQYYFGPGAGKIMSFNFVNTVQLANQNQRICFRRERGFCRTCFSAATITDIGVSFKVAIASEFVKGSICCGYGSVGTKTSGYDCVMIPGASKAATVGVPVPNSICGNGQGLVTATAKIAKTICTSQTPFQLNFLTDQWTFAEAASVFRGFKLDYWQTTC